MYNRTIVPFGFERERERGLSKLWNTSNARGGFKFRSPFFVSCAHHTLFSNCEPQKAHAYFDERNTAFHFVRS